MVIINYFQFESTFIIMTLFINFDLSLACIIFTITDLELGIKEESGRFVVM